MNTARRWYILLVCAISLQAAAWAVIALLRNLLAGGGGTVTSLAFQIAVIIIALPLFLVHWLWAQRLADREVAEREASLRRFYLYGMSGGFLGAGIANAYSLVKIILRQILGQSISEYSYNYQTPLEAILYHLIAILVLGALFYYQQRVLADDAKAVLDTGISATIRRLYAFLFSAWGLTMTTLAVIHLLRWIMYQFDAESITGYRLGLLAAESARLIVGVPLWLLFWGQAQTLFASASEEERASALRKFYLYATVFVSVLTAVSNATIILAAFFRRILGLKSLGDIREPLPLILGAGLLWAYHATVLRGEADRAGEAPRQAGIRRLYLYLVAAVGLAALLVGFSGDLSVLIRSLSKPFSGTLREQLAWFTAALIAGLPVWILPWRQAQLDAAASTPAGVEERRSAVRKNYLYFYLFVATISVLSSAVYILYRILSLILGEPGEGNLWTGIGQAIAYALVGIGVWLYHGSILRGDGEANRREQSGRLETMRVIFLGMEPKFGQSLTERLAKELPGLTPVRISLPLEKEAEPAALEQVAAAGLIVGPWQVAAAGGQVSAAVASSAAHKLLVPAPAPGWDWAGVEAMNEETALMQTARAVKQFMDGEEIKPQRPMSIGSIIGMIVGILLLLMLLAIPMLAYFGS